MVQASGSGRQASGRPGSSRWQPFGPSTARLKLGSARGATGNPARQVVSNVYEHMWAPLVVILLALIGSLGVGTRAVVQQEAPEKTPPRRVAAVTPRYPRAAAAKGIRGPVVLKLTVDADGAVSAVQQVSGYRLLVSAAVTAARKWRFEPPVRPPVTLFAGLNVAPEEAKEKGKVTELTPADRTRPLLPCVTAQSASFAVTIDERGRVTDAIGLQGAEDFVPSALETVLNVLRPPSPPPAALAGSSPFIETVTVNCTPPGIPQPLPVTRPDGPVRLGYMQPPYIWLDVAPVYPHAARDAGVEGRVILDALVMTDGRVDDTWVVGSIPLLDEAAVYAVRQRRLVPLFANNVAVPFIMRQTVTFPPR